ncbi:MAG TPA: hypothetical protein VFR26_07105 [Acidimicrobiales bacterium]|nr:hypothetical protein [Acidimicrobiales bacterium]
MEGDDSQRGAASTSRRVVSGAGGGGRSPWLAVVAVAVLVGVGVVLTRGDNDPAPSSPRDDRTGEPPPTGAEMEVVETADVLAAYSEAAVRFGRAHTFGYRGIVRSAGPSLLRPGPWIAAEVTVEGAVHLPLSITTDVAVDPTGAAAETVTSGAATWARRAPAPDGLAGAPWEPVGGDVSADVRNLPGVPPSRLGFALVVDAVGAATDRQEAPRDAAGRRVIRATVPDQLSSRSSGPEDLDDLIGGAELAVTLDDGGDVARVELTAAPGYPPLEIALDILRLGDPALVTAGDLAEPIRASVPPDVMADVGLGSLDVPGLPTTWALTSASLYRPDGRLSPLPTGCGGSVLALEYHDLRAVADGWLFLSIWRHTCDPDEGQREGTGEVAEVAVEAGRFTGSALRSPGQPYRGDVTDGTTAVSFTTDLSPEDAAAALASLVPGQ